VLAYQYLSQPVLASLSFGVKDDDSFFNPTGLGHTGFAFDTNHYTAGVLDAGHAAPSWTAEGSSATRGPLAAFPEQTVVVISEASFAILDATTDALNLWMLFYLCDFFAYPSTFAGDVASFTAESATWASGLLSITLKAVSSASTFAGAVLTYDFAADSVYVDYSLA
jgi:hypothetical protein